MPQPTVEQYLSAIVQEQKQSGMTPLEFYAALHRIARQTHLLRTVLIRSTFTVGVPNALNGSKPIEIAAPEVIPLCLLKTH